MKRSKRSGSEERSSKRRRESDESSRSSKFGAEERNRFSFLDYKWEFDRMFFCEGEPIVKGTKQHEEFWTFLRKYESLQRKQVGSLGSSDQKKQHYLPFSLCQDVNKVLSRLPPQEYKRSFSTSMVEEFMHILQIFFDFLQKEKFASLCKLRDSQKKLPITNFKSAILDAVKNNPVVIVAGDTGCGKSTQVPQYLVHEGYRNIACTQPRRIACVGLCSRVSHETLDEFGSEVGYQIRFERKKTEHTRILFVTEGLLLRQLVLDPLLSSYDVVILDEVHERHLHTDFLLGVVKVILYRRPNARVILMSATINTQLFSNYFGGKAPLLEIPGRLFPIKVNYRPISIEDKASKNEKINPAPYVRILSFIDTKYSATERGDVLIFLSGMAEIRAVADAAQAYAEKTKRWIVLPLHSSLSVAEQDKVFHLPPEGVRKCIISTNIAETSITIDGVRFVVDSGKVKEMSYDAAAGMQRLKEFTISRASAEQRKGRAGRTGPGVCFRLYSDSEFLAMAPFSEPEIRRVPLESLLLQMLALGLPDPKQFPFLEPPSVDCLDHALSNLKKHGAIDDNLALTALGDMLAHLPVDLAIGKMLIFGCILNQVGASLSLAAAISIQNPFTNRSFRDADCINERKSLEWTEGDPFTLLRAYSKWLDVKVSGKGNSRQWSHKRGIEEQRFYEMTKLRRQFKDLLRDMGLLESEEERLSGLSSTERSIRYGELKQLKDVKREHQQSASGRKKSVLKLRAELWGGEIEEGADIKDLDFRMSTDKTQLQKLHSETLIESHKDVSLLKVILCSGLYPQMALADEHNSYKVEADQLFHTRGKPYAALHPNSVLALNPDVLQLPESDQVIHSGFSSRNPASNRHQILAYLSLLETTKPYLMNTVRVPCAPILLLFAHSIDTNEDASKIVVDSWIELKFLNATHGLMTLVHTVLLRDMFNNLLKAYLYPFKKEIVDDSTEDKRQMSEALSMAALEFLQSDIWYSVKRLLAADIKLIYKGACEEATLLNPFNPEHPVKMHQSKGGYQLRDYLVYDCLVSDGETGPTETWACPLCEWEGLAIMHTKMQHLYACIPADRKPKAEPSASSGAKGYFCLICQETLALTPTQILLHRRQHSAKDKM